MENPLHPNDDPDAYGGGDTVPTPPARVPAGVKVCGVAVLFVTAVVIGSTGHAAYELAFAPDNTRSYAEYVSSAALIAGVDTSEDVCTEPWLYMCGKFDAAHYMSGSRIGDMAMREWKRALAAFVALGTGPSKRMFNKCVAFIDTSDATGCTSLFPANTSIETLWHAGVHHSQIGMSRMANPYQVGVRSVVFWDMTDSSGVEVYPTEYRCAVPGADPCNLCDLYARVMCPTWATETECASPYFLVAGAVDGLCDKWTAITADAVRAQEAAVQEAIYACRRSVGRLSSPLACFLRTATYYPDANMPYIAATPGNKRSVAEWFERAKIEVLKIATAFGPRVRQRVADISVHTAWTSQNLAVPPSQLEAAVENVSAVKMYAAYDKWQTDNAMRTSLQVFPMWQLNSWDINAYYMPSTNAIYIPDAMAGLVDPLDAITVGTLLFIVAHELGHSFDPSAVATSDASGSALVSERTRYNAVEACLKSNYSSKNITIGEDWADFIGMKAVQQYANSGRLGGGDDIKVVGWTVTPQQQALLAFGRFWCASTDADGVAATDPHSLPRDRLINAVSHYAGSLGFSCPLRECDQPA